MDLAWGLSKQWLRLDVSCEPENEELLTSSCSSWETAELLIETKMKMENGL